MTKLIDASRIYLGDVYNDISNLYIATPKHERLPIMFLYMIIVTLDNLDLT